MWAASMAPIARPSGAKFYAKYARQLVEDGYAYYCFCAAKDGDEENAEGTRQQHRDICPTRELPLAEADQKVRGWRSTCHPI